MRIKSVQAIPVRLPRDIAQSRGTAGSPTSLVGEGGYRWSAAYPVLSSVDFETALVRVELAYGLVGWGEAQAPLAPEVACNIVEHLLRPALEPEKFDATPGTHFRTVGPHVFHHARARPERGLHARFDKRRGHRAVGSRRKNSRQPRLRPALRRAKAPHSRLPSGTAGNTPQERAAFATRFGDDGISVVKLYYERDWADLLAIADALQEPMEFAVGALWHLPAENAIAIARELDARDARWLECPLYPEEVEAHAALAAAIRTSLALGESYRSRRELQPFLPFLGILQPDLVSRNSYNFG